MSKISLYVSLTKPRLALGNLIVAVAAFIFASPSAINWQTLVLMFFGLWLIIGSACVFNNIYDSNIDARMARTKDRVLVTGRLSKRSAAIFGSILLVLGVLLLWQTNVFALLSSIVGWVSYVIFYTPLKHRTRLALYVGALAGATPPVVGYTAATGTLNWYAAALFAIIYLWQLPHFLAIARYRYDEYAAAGVPLATRRPESEAEKLRARKIFYASLVALLVICAALIVQRWMR